MRQGVLALITLWIGWWIINRLTGRLAALFTARHMDQALETFVVTLVNIGLKVMLVISVASMIGIATTSFVAALGAASLAIGLSLQGSLANFAGGVLILLFRPFKIGDYIEARACRAPWIRSRSSTPCCAPATTAPSPCPTATCPTASSPTSRARRRGRSSSTSRSATTPICRRPSRVLADMAKDPRVLETPPPAIVVAGLGDTFITVSLRCWTANSDFWGTQFTSTSRSAIACGPEGIDIALPSRVVKVIDDKGDERAARGRARRSLGQAGRP